MKAKFVIGGVIIVVFTIWAIMSMKTTLQYVSLEKAKTSKQVVQVIGKIDFDKVNYNEEESRLEFAVYDAEAESKENAVTMDVIYYGVKPGNFEQATSVVLKGKTDGDRFIADQMLVKCPSKYQGEEGEYQDMEKHNEATGGSGA